MERAALGEYEHVSPTKGTIAMLAKSAVGQHVPRDEGAACLGAADICRDDIEIPVEPSVLESIVENEHIAELPFLGKAGAECPPSRHHHRAAGAPSQQEGLVANERDAVIWRNERRTSRTAAVTTCEYDRPISPRLQLFA
jgi:hypothetical protein